MSIKLKAAAQLIKDKEFDLAIEILERNASSLQSYPLMSLLYRYKGNYDKEKEFVEKSLNLNDNNTYMQERLSWHKLPLFDRLVPRQPLCLPRDPFKIPTQLILDQLCFVTAGGSDSPYRECLIELLESIRATKSYRIVHIAILDAGLTDADKNLLLEKFENITILDPDWDVDIGPKDVKLGMKGCSARPFIPKHFPGYRYYFWLDTDTWVQDERALDNILFNAITYGFGLVKDHAEGNWPGCWWQHTNQTSEQKIYPDSYDIEIGNNPFITAGTFCIDVQTGLFEKWAESFESSFEQFGLQWGIDEVTFNHAVHKFLKAKHIPVLDRIHQSVCIRYGFPVVLENEEILRDPLTLRVLGIIHFIAFQMTKGYHFFPMHIVNRSLTEHDRRTIILDICHLSSVCQKIFLCYLTTTAPGHGQINQKFLIN